MNSPQPPSLEVTTAELAGMRSDASLLLLDCLRLLDDLLLPNGLLFLAGLFRSLMRCLLGTGLVGRSCLSTCEAMTTTLLLLPLLPLPPSSCPGCSCSSFS